VRDLRSIGIQPTSFSAAPIASSMPTSSEDRALLRRPEEAVITAKDVPTIYEVPLVLAVEGLDRIILKLLTCR
jgi:CTP synthase